MENSHIDSEDTSITRRSFMQTAATAGAGLALAASAESQEKKPADLKVAIIGPGSQGRNLITKAVKMPGIRFVALADIWPYHQKYSANILKKYKHLVNVYSDYQDLLEKEKDLDAVIIATPDWVHAEQAVACLKAGLHVYCEKEMSNTLEGARKMVLAARETGKLLQIGHQRRSNPRYWHALRVIEKDKVLGRITHFNGQWNRAKRFELGWPKKKSLDEATLKKYGYDTMERFRNWRWYKKFSGGPIADLGSHQIDIFSWFLRSNPKAVIAGGGRDYYQSSEWYDNVMAIYEYDTRYGPVRGFYQVLNTTSHGGFFETFMGDEGSIVISEDTRKGYFLREITAKRRAWEDESDKVDKMGVEAIELKIGETLTADGKKDPKGEALLAESKKPPHQLHLENFFRAIREGTPLSCPSEVGFETAVSVLKVNDAIASGQRLEFNPSEFKV